MNSGVIFFKYLTTIFRKGFKPSPTLIFTDMYVIQHFIELKKKKKTVGRESYFKEELK